MTNQRINDVDTITTFSGTDRLLVNTDVLNNVLEQIEKDDFVADIISTDANNLIELGTDNKVATFLPANVTTQGNTFNGNSQLIQTTVGGLYPALDGSLITNIAIAPEIPISTCATASATASKTATLAGVVIADDIHFYINFTNANTSATITLNVNSEGDWGIYDLKGNQITGAYFNNAAGETCLFKADKTNSKFILVNSQFMESRTSMPSSVYSSLTLGATGSTYTAPADGYYTLVCSFTVDSSFIQLVNNNNGISNSAHSGANSSTGTISRAASVACSAGQIIQVNYSGVVNVTFRFISTEGGKP